jgi:hypothetical protein
MSHATGSIGVHPDGPGGLRKYRANAATLALSGAERALGAVEKELSALMHRGPFERPRKEELDAAMAKVAAARKARDDAKAALEKAKTLQSWRGQEVAKARREAYEPAKAQAIARMLEIAERADAKRAELAAIGVEFDGAASNLQAAVAAGAHGGGGPGFRFASVASAEALRSALRDVFGMAAT